MRHKSIPPLRTFVTFVLIGILLTQLPQNPAPSVLAEESAGTPSTTGTTTDTDTKCVDAIAETVKKDTDDFIAFVKEHFQNEEQNSDLLDTAVEKYRAYRDVVNSLLVTYATQFTEQSVLDQSDDVFTCQNFVTQQIKTARDVLISHNKQISRSKTTFALVEDYKSLNAQLRDLNLTVGTLSALFDKLNNNVSCYPKGCVK